VLLTEGVHPRLQVRPLENIHITCDLEEKNVSDQMAKQGFPDYALTKAEMSTPSEIHNLHRFLVAMLVFIYRRHKSQCIFVCTKVRKYLAL
jgi:hypothetical protein